MHDENVLIPLFAIIGWVVVAVARMWSRGRVRELEIRERIALIERGLVPPPDKDPEGFDRMMNRYTNGGTDRRHGRHRRTGVILMAIGAGLFMLIGLNDQLRHGLGVGGFLFFLGLGFFVSSLFETSAPAPEAARPAVPTPPASPTPASAAVSAEIVPAVGDARS